MIAPTWVGQPYYAHFDNKQDLLLSGFDALRATLREHQRQAHARRGGADDRLFAFTREIFDHVAGYRDVFRAMAGEQSGALIHHLMHKLIIDLVREDVKAALARVLLRCKRARPGCASPARLGYGTQSLTVFVESIEAHFERAKSAGAKLLEDLHETVYGELQYAVEDLDGHHWLFSRHARDLSPEEWGAKLARR